MSLQQEAPVAAAVSDAVPSAPISPSAGHVGALPDLVVRARNQNRMLQGGRTYRIGRDPASDIAINDPRVSWAHAVLRVEGAGWVLEDLGSSNGTFLGPDRTRRVEIAGTCEVRLGHRDNGPVVRFQPQLPTAMVAVPRAPGSGTPGGAQAGSSAPAMPPGPRTMPGTPSAMAAYDPSATRVMPSVVDRPTSMTRLGSLATTTLKIGRSPDNDLVLEDLEVSRRHAELRRRTDGTYEIADVGSNNGTYVNGRRITSRVLTESDIIGIGHSTFRLRGSELSQFVDQGAVTFTARDLVVTVNGGKKTLMDHLSLSIPEKCLVGVLGPSGAGKSTLLGALTGMRPADTGTVLYDSRDLYANYDELRYRIGLVPQENILHTQLTARRALQYAAELRFSTDTTAQERDARIDEVMAELGLSKHADTRADRLSGGQLKRVNVAQELLTKPSLLFLDEPTSGLDPGLDKSVMKQMRDLAHDGRTIIVVTHSVANISVCDRLLFLVPGGKVGYFGPPDEGLRYFDLSDWADVFLAIEAHPERDWAAEFRASPYYAQYVASDDVPAPETQQASAAAPRRRGWLGQVTTLTRRFAQVIAADRGFLIMMAVLPVVLGLLIHFVPAAHGLSGFPGTRLTAQEVLQLLITSACLAGTAASFREIVKERPIYIRERAAGLSAFGYLLSKLLILGAVSIVQSVVIVLIGLSGRAMPPNGSFLHHLPLVEILIAVGLLAMSSMCLGLMVSALVNTSEKAVPFLVMLVVGQIVLSGGVVPLAGIAGLSQVSWIAPARWGLGAAASTANVNTLTPVTAAADPLWNHTPSTWLRDIGLTVALAVVFLIITWIQLRRLGPRRRKARA
jgi:ABC-type multidrug transport system ATPase subunit/pSer/pThr/pTyr-binding forkhead associated (FHA) protein/ABC-type multidrug transport system permease subunit